MRKYVIKRLIATVPLLIVVSFVCFLMIQAMSSDPAEVVLRVRQTPVITEEAIEEMSIELGLDKPFLVRYGHWLMDSFRFDFGVSYVHPSRTVASELKRCLPATLQLALATVSFVMIISLILGTLAAYYKDTWIDKIIRFFIFTFSAMPSYWFALLSIWIFSLTFNWLPTSGRGGLETFVLPVLTLSLGQISIYVRLIRSNMVEVLKEDYILYAKARGIGSFKLLIQHVLKNSLQSSIAAFGMSIPQLIAGTIVVEKIFSWPGIGRLSIEAILSRDYPLIQGYVWMIALLFIFFNLIFDIIHVFMDPRLKNKELA